MVHGERYMQPTLFDKPEERPKSKLLRDPAMAAAIAKCLIARMEPASRITRQAHPMQCRWCKYTFGRLADALNEFNTWAGWEGLDRPPGNQDPDWPTLEPQVEAFMRLPYEEQIRLCAIAAGYPEDTFTKNTGYEYPVGEGNVSDKSGNVSEVGQKGRGLGESVTDEQKVSSPGAPAVEPQPVGGRDGAGNRRGRGIGGPETAEGTQDRGVLDRAAEAPGPGEGDSPIQIDRYRNPDGSSQPF
jgi:hypothetical protein